MYICICNAVTEREIRHAVELGCNSYKKLHNELGVGTCCGKCKKEATRVVKDHANEMREMESGCGGFDLAL